MVVQTVVFATMYTGITLRTDLSKGVYDRFRSMPIWGPSPLVGAMLGDTVRYTLAGVLVFAVGAVMGYRPPGGDSGGGGGSWLGPAAAVVLLNAFAFGLSWVFTTLALLLRSPNTVMTLSWLILMPITFASNVYVTLESMPDWLRRIVSLNPVTHVTTATRALCNGEATAGQIGLALLGPAVLTAVLSPLAMLLYRRER
jgi:ABC-2 type transport system permease protein